MLLLLLLLSLSLVLLLLLLLSPLSLGSILCSVCYDEIHPDIDTNIKNDDHDEGICTGIVITDNEDFLIGSFNNGSVRVWELNGQSLITLNKLLLTYSNTDTTMNKHHLAISPIILISISVIHDNPIVSLSYTTFQYEEVLSLLSLLSLLS